MGFLFILAAFLLVGSGILLSFSFFTYGGVILTLGVLTLLRIRMFYKHTNRNIALFFDAVRNNDTTLVFPVETKNESLNQLHRSLNAMNQHIQKVKLEAEIREKYYIAIIEQSATGFIVMNNDFGIELINEAACLLAGISVGSSNPNLLKIKNNPLFQTLCTLKAGQNFTFKNYHKFIVQQLLLKATEIKTGSRNLMLFSLQDIRPELSEQEIESYQKLISILTHEIMNSLAPITSISKTLNTIFINENLAGNFSDIQISTTVTGLKAIEEQSEAVLNFVGNYRKLIKIPPPDIRTIDVREWIPQLYILYKTICQDKNIQFEIKNEGKSDFFSGDKNLLNQVMINLINNAIEALEEVTDGKRIQIVFSPEKENYFIRVGNNGPIIPQSLQDTIFVPFFTTKENGSGIGLSIASQIVKLHKGTLDVFSDESIGTIFTIKL
jgi:signal transduction histidine kinase